MKTASSIFSVIGFVVVALFFLASLGVGHFRIFYGPVAYTCTKDAA